MLRTLRKKYQKKLDADNVIKSEEVKAGEKYVFNNLEAGYYLLKDLDDSQKVENGSYTQYLLKVVGPVEAETKLDVPKVEKFVKDKNDSEEADYQDWSKTADHDFKDEVPFKLEGSLPSNYEKYETYKYVFHDEMSKGLTLNEHSINVYTIKKGAKVELSKLADYKITTSENKFDITFENLKLIEDITKEHKIVVEYTATLNEQAVIGSQGNPNEVYLEYSNNPNHSGEGTPTGTTPKQKVIVFTYKTIVNKVDEQARPLPDAEFMLEKKMQNGSYKEVSKAIVNEGKTIFEFKGLDDGQYRLTETKTPKGYNTIKPIEFKITAEHDNSSLKLTGLNGEKVSGEITLTANMEQGLLSTNVVNKQGPELPETGGRGTTILYTIGALLVLGGAAYLIARKNTLLEK